MAIREYIGARYVPIFDGDWDITKTYEPLVIVNYQGNSFTSKKYVPSGVQITNADYWASSGNYSQQIEQLRQELNAAMQEIADLQEIATDPIAIAHGGTGSSTAADARAALEITPANIGALATTGGTVNGVINLIANEYIKSSNLESGTRPTVNTSGAGIQFRDMGDSLVGSIAPRFFTDGLQTMQLVTSRVVNDVTVTNGIVAGIAENGDAYYSVNDPKAWQRMVGMSAAQIDAGHTWNTSFTGSSCFVTMSRGSFWIIGLIDYWSGSMTIIAQSSSIGSGSMPTITKAANSSAFSITNNYTLPIAVEVISIPMENV